MNPQRIKQTVDKLRSIPLRQHWDKIKFEVKWRWEDIKHEHSAGIPNDPGEPEPKKIPLSAQPKIIRDTLVDTFTEIKDGVMYYVNMFKKNNESWDSQYREEVGESMVIPRNDKKENQQEPEKQFTNSLHDWEKFQTKFQHIVRSRFMLVQTCIRQFMIGYNEGMGRDIESFKKRKELSDLLGTNQMFNKDQWMDQVKNVASGIKKFREEMHDIAVIKDDDQLLKEDLQKAELISQQDSKVLLNNEINEKSPSNHDETNNNNNTIQNKSS
ncbi:predicted protein [Naegleria gruberi]|uniref:Predicted protein n=1 Tax=Naegleria gruberi TaxID=5762 RepID=D2UX83_NAEGR|nr:uncharacterized protein NAEGRDRAFT_45306 [Naegleria gruberi]EFC50883.1 predicted protein [Naegleria gruberi]|eukprot:XP_002683627.1 predicted protein [Naegleria gruberi strain NEG-M]